MTLALLLKIVITPALIGSATVLGRRFGPAFSGWLVGFPFTSAPVSVFLVLEQGDAFASHAAAGSIASALAQTAFAGAYVAARRRGWGAATSAGTLAFVVAGLLLRSADLPAGAAALVAAVALTLAVWLVPRGVGGTKAPTVVPRWDLPARAIVATVLVLALTSVAPLLGPLASGIASGFPLYAAVLAVFAHRHVGSDAARDVMRGLVVGLFGFASFFLVVALVLLPLGVVATFALATLAVFSVQAVALAWLRRGRVAV